MEQRNNKTLFSLITILMLLFGSCDGVDDTLHTKELVSSTGEKVYINTLNWGVTDDNQYTVIAKDKNRLKTRSDTLNTMKGLSPFVYRFHRDTLSFFYLKWKEVKVSDSLQSIKLAYYPLDNKEYMRLLNKAGKKEDGYSLVP
ncbi:MAG: hypothetical protein LBF27_22210 [Sphingobacterium sp.]|jgi:hypothetical protein|nr:hypothetical protein [Sphingobacterium sp.]